MPVLRWPASSFADEYLWRDGIGPPANKRPKTLNTWWGIVTEDNSFGTHEFIELYNLISIPDLFADAKKVGDKRVVNLPPKSVAVLELK